MKKITFTSNKQLDKAIELGYRFTGVSERTIIVSESIYDKLIQNRIKFTIDESY